jgi:hypothetical protein
MLYEQPPQLSICIDSIGIHDGKLYISLKANEIIYFKQLGNFKLFYFATWFKEV